MNPRQSRLGMPLVTHLVIAFNLFRRLLHGGGRVGNVSRLTVQRILRVDHVEPFAPAPFGTIFEIELTTEKQFFFV